MVKFSIIVLGALLASLQLRLWVLEGGYAEVHRLQAEISDLTAHNQKMRKRNAGLHAEISDLKSGVAAIEGRARTQLGMIGPGEEFYLIIEDDKPAPAGMQGAMDSRGTRIPPR